MKASNQNATLTLPPDLLAEVEAIAEQEHRPADDVLRDAVERYRAQLRQEAPERAARRTAAEAAVRMLAHRPLRKLPEGESIRSMLEHGRA
jgi:Ribbon-helix-helix protein, copG family